MKTNNIVKSTTLALAISAALSSPVTSFAEELFTVPPSPVYQAVKNSSLKDTLTQVSQRSGIVFKINTEIGQEVVHQSLAAADWTSAVKSLLSDYNYILVTEGKTAKTVIITGRAGNGTDATHAVVSVEPAEYKAPVIISPKMSHLPKQYKNYPAGSVMAVSIPVKEIMALGKGKTAKFDSPLGQFNIAHDNTVQEADGSKTWVGHLADEGQGYRMLVSEGPAGVMGHVTTPEGTFNLESVNGQTFMVDTSKLDQVGYTGDTIHSTMDADAVTANATLTLEQLKAALDAAKANLDAANSSAASTAALTNYNLALKAYNDASLAAVAPPPIAVPPLVELPAGENQVLDIMVLYTTHTQTAAFAKQRMAYLVTASNQAYTDSGIKLTLRLVYAEPTNYTDQDVNRTALYNLANEVDVFAGTAAKRVQYGADLVYLFRPLNALTQKTCGTTYLEMADGQPPNKWLGFGVISDGTSKDAMSNAYCDISTFTHEIGHSLGLVHDREYSNEPGAFSYSYAWGIEGSFGTIMSYKAPVVMYFSTPALTNKCANGPCGYPETDTVKSSDQVKSVNLTVSNIVSFMPTMMTAPVIK
ncbi:MAG: zinc-dependent metalloprotease family protein [Methylobacter sp.]|nr:zinc-dependent metalloprotease family protein [Methylobacter sp.]